MSQCLIGKDNREHGFGYRNRADGNTGIVAAPGDNLGLHSADIDGAAWRQY